MAERVAGTYDNDTKRTGYDAPRTGHVAVAGRRISWGAVLAGVIIVLIVQLLLSLLGVGIGASTIDPMQGDTPRASTLGIGAGAATGPASDRPRRGSTMNSRTSTASAIPGSPTVIIATRQP